MLLLAGFCGVTADVLLSGPLADLDWTVHLLVEEYVRGPWWVLSDVLAYAGNQYVLIGSLGLLCILAAIRYRTLRPMLVVLVVCVSLAIIVPGLKIITGRTPPHTEVDLVFTSHTEYPSGHAVNAIVIWGTFLELVRATSRQVERLLPPRVRDVLIALATAAGGLGMVGMDYHWLTDVYAGWMLGAAMFIAFLGWDPFRPIRNQRDAGIQLARGRMPPTSPPRVVPNPRDPRRARRSPDRS